VGLAVIVSVFVAVPVKIGGVCVRVTVGWIVAVSVRVGVMLEGVGARAIAIHPMQ